MSTITNEVTKAISKFQDETRRLYENNIQLQKNVFYSCQSAYGQFLENIPKLYWNNSRIPERFNEAHNSISKNVVDNITNRTNFINEMMLENIEKFGRNIEFAQRYFNDTTRNYFNYQNYFNYVKELERAYNNK